MQQSTLYMKHMQILMQHLLTNAIASKTILPKIFEVAKINRFDAYGNPNEELQKVLTSFGSQVYNLFTGFSR